MGTRDTDGNEPRSIDRRSFLRAVGGASTAAVTVAAAITPEEANAFDPGEAESGAKYKPDNPDVQAFYRANGYETLKK